MNIIFVNDDYNDNKYYYHGTNNIQGIIEDQKICTDYFDLHGSYITSCYENAYNHGCYVFQFSKSMINESNFYIDDVNDGILYLDGIDLKNKDYNILVNKDDYRFIKSIILNMIEQYKENGI